MWVAGAVGSAGGAGVVGRSKAWRAKPVGWGRTAAGTHVLVDDSTGLRSLDARHEKGALARDGVAAWQPRIDGADALQRLQRGVELNKVTSFDFQDVLQPVHREDPDSPQGYDLVRPLTIERVQQVTDLARLVADRAKVPDQPFDDVQVDKIVQREIQRGAQEGSY